MGFHTLPPSVLPLDSPHVPLHRLDIPLRRRDGRRIERDPAQGTQTIDVTYALMSRVHATGSI